MSVVLEEKRMGMCEYVDSDLDDSADGSVYDGDSTTDDSMTGGSMMNGTMVTRSSYDEVES